MGGALVLVNRAFAQWKRQQNIKFMLRSVHCSECRRCMEGTVSSVSFDMIIKGIRHERGLGSAIFCNFSQFCNRNFPQFFRNCLLLVHLACLLVPCVVPVQKGCSLRFRELWLRHCDFPANLPPFSAIFPIPPPPRLHTPRSSERGLLLIFIIHRHFKG